MTVFIIITLQFCSAADSNLKLKRLTTLRVRGTSVGVTPPLESGGAQLSGNHLLPVLTDLSPSLAGQRGPPVRPGVRTGSVPLGADPAPPEPGLWTPAPSGPGWTGPCLACALSPSPAPALSLVLAAAAESPGSGTRADPPAVQTHGGGVTSSS